jgi:capsule biosynthesis phosphatase
MIVKEKCIVMDIDGTLCHEKTSKEDYSCVLPKVDVLNKLFEYKEKGFYIILFTSRQMRTFDGNLGKINANTVRTTVDWLEKHKIPFDEIYFGKPWCGHGGFYVDDKAIRPDEFLNLTYEEILDKIG